MEVVDFPHSYLMWRVDITEREAETLSHKPPYALNNARIPVDATCDIRDRETGVSERFVLGCNCKTEQVGAERDIWLQPNADFIPVFSATHFSYIKTYDHTGRTVMFYPVSRGPQPHRDRVSRNDAFESSEIALAHCEAEPLATPDAIVNAILGKYTIVCRTTIESERYVATLEYPAKSINANERDMIYQTDTGPVLVPNMNANKDALMDGLELGFAAFNCPDWIEFLVRVPVKVSADITVMHYAETVRFDAKNEAFRVV